MRKPEQEKFPYPYEVDQSIAERHDLIITAGNSELIQQILDIP